MNRPVGPLPVTTSPANEFPRSEGEMDLVTLLEINRNLMVALRELLARAELAASQSPPNGRPVPLAELERRAILDAIEYAEGDKRRAAELLGISRAKIYQRLKHWKESGTKLA